jgi:prepilin-type N-terminal cleavage/methylation domain-containing protein
MNTQARLRRQGAFTIIELLVVIVIIGVLTGIAASSYVTAQRRARDNARKAAVNTIANAVETYYAALKHFPGKIVLATGQQAPEQSLRNCEQTVDIAGDFAYFYYPFDANSTSTDPSHIPCDKRSATANDPDYTPTSYKPFPTWIPGLGDYLGSPVIDRQYLSYDGSTGSESSGLFDSSGNFKDVLGADDASGQNFSRTLVYRHLNGGYAVYTRLESATGDSDTLDGTNGAITPGGSPTLPAGTSITGKNIYLIRK